MATSPRSLRRLRRTPLLKLPDVTLVAVDTVAPELLRLAISDCLAAVEPAAVIVWSDSDPAIPGVQNVPIPKLAGIDDYGRVLWFEVPFRVNTSHFLVIQWDGWIINPERWDPVFLRYDYIGAVWPWFKHARVGCGGFSLRSTRLAQHIANQPTEYPLNGIEDELLCRRYRYRLDRDGKFLWAPEQLAAQFSFECAAPPPSDSFGFHDCRNFLAVLDQDRLHERLACANEYVRGKTAFCQLQEVLSRQTP